MHVADEVATALEEGRPVVALESALFSLLGLPAPHNEEALRRCLEAVRAVDAVPAVTGVVDGVATLGLGESAQERMLAAETKCTARDLPVAHAQGWPFGATTVSAGVTLAARARVRVLATGAIGGVHRDVAETGDVSQDLHAIAGNDLAVVSAGAKSFLDLRRTLEYLETLGVPVLGLGVDEFPAFFSRGSGHPVQAGVATIDEAAAVVRARWDLDGGGILLAAPVPEEAEIPYERVEALVNGALTEAVERGIAGSAVTPYVLDRLATATGGASVQTNLALAEHNARVGAALAARLQPVARP